MQEKKLDIYKIIWLFVIGCLFGYVLETVFYVIKYGYYVNKQGLIIGPFKPIYGTAMVVASLLFDKLNLNKKWKIFVIGTVLGTIFEYLCSYFLEAIWGLYIWDYSSFNYNINGRIYLPYCLVWGIISIIWYCYLYPLYLKVYDRIKLEKIKIISLLVGIFMVINVTLTFMIYFRIQDSDNNCKVYQIVDKIFPKEEVKSKFSKVRKINK